MADKEKEIHDVKYIRELIEYYSGYMSEVINEIYIGVSVSLGLGEKEAYQLANRKPGQLEKGFFGDLWNRFKSVFSYKAPKFRPKKGLFGTGEPMTAKQWDVFNRSLDEYWQKAANDITGDVTTKSFLLGRQTTQFRDKKKPYKNKSLYQVVKDQYNGNMPKRIDEAYRKYDFKNSEKKIYNKSLSDVSMYVTQANNDIKNAIRQQVTAGIAEGKSSVEIASDMYWNIQKDEQMMNKYSAETLKRNWNRVAATEMAYVYEAGILAPHEGEAMESLKDPGKAKYFVRIGGTCKWCQGKQGTVVRLVPSEIVEDHKEESLKSMGIDDPNTDIAIWPGKSNVGLKQDKWNICCPAHPYNVATFAPINLKDEFYNPKTKSVEKRQEKQKFVPQAKDYTITAKDKEERKPKKIGGGMVQFNNNVYVPVPAGEYNSRLEEWRQNPSLPIPVNQNSPQYRQIFDAVKD